VAANPFVPVGFATTQTMAARRVAQGAKKAAPCSMPPAGPPGKSYSTQGKVFSSLQTYVCSKEDAFKLPSQF